MSGGRLEGRVALVTGASRGFGRAIALGYLTGQIVHPSGGWVSG